MIMKRLFSGMVLALAVLIVMPQLSAPSGGNFRDGAQLDTRLSGSMAQIGALWAREARTVPAPRTGPRAAGKNIAVTILFFNDLHGNLLPLKVKEGDKTTEVGGLARLAALVRKIRAENTRKGGRTFLLVAGDMLQGTPQSTVFQGAADMDCFNEMAVTVMAVGNHEFDFGLENFLSLKKAARFPIISANIVWKETRKPLNESLLVLPLTRDCALTIIGVTTDELLTTTAPVNVTKLDVVDPLAAVKPLYSTVSGRGPVILLSHNKYQTDAGIAEALPGLIAVIGGHDQVLFNPHRSVGGVPIFQAFEKGKYLGRIDFVVDTKTRRAKMVKWAYLPVTPSLPADPAVAAIIMRYQSKLDAQFKEVLGTAAVFFDGERGRIRYEETNLGNFVADVMREHTGADVALINAGALRASINQGTVTMDDVFKAMPYPNEVYVASLTGEEIYQVIGRAVKGSREDEDGGFLHVSGIRIAVKDRRSESITLADGLPLERAKTYRVAITDFMASGGDGYTMFAGREFQKTGSPLRELLVTVIRKKGTIDTKVDGRIRRLP